MEKVGLFQEQAGKFGIIRKFGYAQLQIVVVAVVVVFPAALSSDGLDPMSYRSPGLFGRL